jgi:DEAD/DEAH box helicase domain-containing protein
LGEEKINGAIKYFGEIQVTSSVIAYKKINWNRYEILDQKELDLPPTILNSMGFWISLTEETERLLRNSGEWSSSPNDYGDDWKERRQLVLSRDQFTCAMCGKTLQPSSLHVHHKIPLRSFSSLMEANQLSNLISLCPRCHQRAEAVVRVKSGLSGLGYLLHSLAPLLLMCDSGDLGLHTEFTSPLGYGRPTILLYEQIPAGIGFSHFLFNHIGELMEKALTVVRGCPCENGCPGCVGPGGELGTGGKKETEAILTALSS